MSLPPIQYYYINLDHAADRRSSAERQAREFGIDLHRIEAIYGKDLDISKLDRYSEETRSREFMTHLTPNEHACILSHLKALQAFLDCGSDYGVILEDDFLLQPGFKDGIEWLITRTSGWEALKLFTEDGKIYPVYKPEAGARWQVVFPKKLPWVAVGNLYTRKGAAAVLESFQTYWMGYDVQWAWNLLARRVPVCGIHPSLVITSDPDNARSTIDADAPRMDQFKKEAAEKTLGRYIRHRLAVWRMAWGKWRMRRQLRRCIRVIPQKG